MVEPILPKKLKKLNVESIGKYLSYGGALDKLSENFEERKSQIQLTKSIAEAFNKNLVGVFEAGTGVGKSFAYLIPAMIWAAGNKERVIVRQVQSICSSSLLKKIFLLRKKFQARRLKPY